MEKSHQPSPGMKNAILVLFLIQQSSHALLIFFRNVYRSLIIVDLLYYALSWLVVAKHLAGSSAEFLPPCDVNV